LDFASWDGNEFPVDSNSALHRESLRLSSAVLVFG